MCEIVARDVQQTCTMCCCSQCAYMQVNCGSQYLLLHINKTDECTPQSYWLVEQQQYSACNIVKQLLHCVQSCTFASERMWSACALQRWWLSDAVYSVVLFIISRFVFLEFWIGVSKAFAAVIGKYAVLIHLQRPSASSTSCQHLVAERRIVKLHGWLSMGQLCDQARIYKTQQSAFHEALLKDPHKNAKYSGSLIHTGLW